MTRPLPWHDTPKCRNLVASRVPGEVCLVECGGPVVMDTEMGLSPCCGACGVSFRAKPEEAEQIKHAEAAWSLVLAGKVHEDRACARCGGVLPIDQERLCPGCVAADMARRQGVLL